MILRLSNRENKRSPIKDLFEIQVDESVWATNLNVHGKVAKHLSEPRSYLMQAERSLIHRN